VQSKDYDIFDYFTIIVKKEKDMTRLQLLKTVNIILALSFFAVSIPGIIQFVTQGAIPYSTFRAVHPIAGTTFTLAGFAHIALNFKWIKLNYFKKKKK
jgi:hypothetical protein